MVSEQWRSCQLDPRQDKPGQEQEIPTLPTVDFKLQKKKLIEFRI
jgi:hypothetical protein